MFIASLNGTAGAELANFNHFSRPVLARSVNTLWFLSLTLALVVALLAILAKQWLGEYTSRMRRHIGSQRRWAWRHLAYHTGLEKWRMDAFISTLPLMLHISLLLFLVGLVAFLTDLDWVIVAFVLPLTMIVAMFYVCATFAPLWFGDCPTATPILRQGRRVLEFVQNRIRRRLFSLRASIGLRLDPRSWVEVPFSPTSWRPPAYDEDALLKGASARRDATVLHWMISSLPAAEEIDVALDAVGSLDPLEHRHQFHLSPSGTGASSPIAGDILCLGHASTAASARFLRLCKDPTSGDAATIARCIRTLLSLSVDRLQTLRLSTSRTNAAHISLLRWASIPSHDLHLLCNTFLAWGNSQCMHIRDAVLAWADDAGPETGETPFLPSSIALSFLRCGPYTPQAAVAMALTYSTLSGPLASSVLDPNRRRAASNILRDAASASVIQSSSNGAPVERLFSMQTSQQLHFRAISTVGGLWRSSSDLAPADLSMRRILAAKFVHLISTLPKTETLTLEQLADARDILDIVPWLRPEDVHVAPKILELIGDYLCQLGTWSEDAGEMTRQLIKLCTDPNSNLPESDLATYLAFRLSHSHRNIYRSFEMVICHSPVNMLLPGMQGQHSVWRMLCSTAPRGIQADHIIRFAGVLAEYLTSFKRRGFDVTGLVEELLGDDRLYNIIYAAAFHWPTAHLAQHARELSNDWWESTKARLLSSTNSDDNKHRGISTIPSPLAVMEEDGLITASSMRVGLIQKVDASGVCVVCDAFHLEGSPQDTLGDRNNAEFSFMAQAYRQTRAAIMKMTRRGRALIASDAEDHELSVNASPLMAPQLA